MTDFESLHPRDDHGRFGLGSWAAKKAPESAGKLLAGKRVWTDKLPAGMKDETWKAHFDKHPWRGGAPSPERLKLHEKIIDGMLKGVSTPDKDEQKVAIFTMGAPASGKSSMLHGVDSKKFVMVDSDAVMGHLPEYQRATSLKSSYRGAATMAYAEASYVASHLLDKAISQGKHCCIDGTGSNAPALIEKMQRMKAAGYHIHLTYAHLGSATEGIARNALRAETSGRYVPERYMKKAYHDIPRNFERISKSADTFAVHDTSKPGSPVVWEKTPTGENKRDAGFVSSFQSRYKR